jgi:hypothetical protein
MAECLYGKITNYKIEIGQQAEKECGLVIN